jgi:hypothetical protein
MMLATPPPVIVTGTTVSPEADVVMVLVKLLPAKVMEPPSMTSLTDVAILAPVYEYAFTVKLALEELPE